MGEYYWDEKIEYLMNTRNLYYNDDYISFLVSNVWKITDPVNIIDFGCGYGFLGLKLMPLLPQGSSYTGVDLGDQLLSKAKEIFDNLSYEANFIQSDVNEFVTEKKFDIAVCHALLLHMSDPIHTLNRMIDCISDNGRIICFEPHWIANMSTYNVDIVEQTNIVKLGILQNLYEMQTKQNGKDGNVGIKIPIYLSQLGVKNIECRVSDKVLFLDPNSDQENRSKLYESLVEEGIGSNPGELELFVNRLMKQGLDIEDAKNQYNAEFNLHNQFSVSSAFVGSTGMKITSGIIQR